MCVRACWYVWVCSDASYVLFNDAQGLLKCWEGVSFPLSPCSNLSNNHPRVPAWITNACQSAIFRLNVWVMCVGENMRVCVCVCLYIKNVKKFWKDGWIKDRSTVTIMGNALNNLQRQKSIMLRHESLINCCVYIHICMWICVRVIVCKLCILNRRGFKGEALIFDMGMFTVRVRLGLICPVRILSSILFSAISCNLSGFFASV